MGGNGLCVLRGHGHGYKEETVFAQNIITQKRADKRRSNINFHAAFSRTLCSDKFCVQGGINSTL